MAPEKMWGTQFVLHIRQCLPNSECCDHDEAYHHWTNHGRIARGLICCVDNANKGKTNTRHNDSGANIIQIFDSLVPRNAFGMLGWLIEEKQGCERTELRNETTPIDIFPGARVDRDLQAVSIGLKE